MLFRIGVDVAQACSVWGERLLRVAGGAARVDRAKDRVRAVSRKTLLSMVVDVSARLAAA